MLRRATCTTATCAFQRGLAVSRRWCHGGFTDGGGLDGSIRSCVIAIDGHAMLYRAYHGFAAQQKVADIVDDDLEKAAGRAARGYLYGYFGLRAPDVVGKYGTSEVVVLFDGGAYARSEVLPGYKSNREGIHTPASDTFVAAGAAAVRSQKNIIVVPKARGEFAAEADDLVFTLVERARARENTDLIIVSHDKDLLSMVDTPSRVFYHSMRTRQLVNEEGVQKTIGVPPHLVNDYLALVGDAIDCIPGVDGVGKTSAAKLLLEHGSLEAVQAAAEKCNRDGTRMLRGFRLESQRNLVLQRESALRMRDVVIALRNVPEPFQGITFGFEAVQEEKATPVEKVRPRVVATPAPAATAPADVKAKKVTPRQKQAAKSKSSKKK